MAGDVNSESESGAGQSVRTGILFLLVTVFVITTMDVFVKTLSTTNAVPMIVWARYTFHFVVLLPLIVRLGPRAIFATKRPVLQIVRSLILFVTTILFFAALSLLPLADATAIMFAGPLIATALSVPMLGEHVGPRRWASVVAGFIGVLIVIRPGMGAIGWTGLLPLAAATTYGLYQITTRIVSRTDGPLTTLAYTALTGTVAMNLAAPFFWQMPTTLDWGMLVIVGALGGLGQFLFIKAYSHATPSVLAPFIYTQLIWATLFGILVFGHFPDFWTIVGALVIAASGLYIWHREHRRAERRPARS